MGLATSLVVFTVLIRSCCEDKTEFHCAHDAKKSADSPTKVGRMLRVEEGKKGRSWNRREKDVVVGKRLASPSLSLINARFSRMAICSHIHFGYRIDGVTGLPI